MLFREDLEEAAHHKPFSIPGLDFSVTREKIKDVIGTDRKDRAQKTDLVYRSRVDNLGWSWTT